jgi:hypothetical protein
VGSKGYTQGVVNRVEDLKEIDAHKGILKMGGIAAVKDFLFTDKGSAESGKIFIELYDVRQNKFFRILPTK